MCDHLSSRMFCNLVKPMSDAGKMGDLHILSALCSSSAHQELLRYQEQMRTRATDIIQTITKEEVYAGCHPMCSLPEESIWISVVIRPHVVSFP